MSALLPRCNRLLLLVLSLVLAVAVLPSGTASAAAAPIVQCNSILNQGGQTVECTVTVVNTLNAATGVGSSVVTVQQCTGPAGAPICSTPVTSSFPDVVTSVSQCNGSASGGGGATRCSVSITNDITGGATPTAATVNQCIGSGDGSGTVECSPVGSTSGATVTQCNGSGNGGGSTVRCTVAPGSTQSASLLVTVDQCNGSANGGGATVTCSTTIRNNALTAPAPSPSASPSAAPSPSASPSAAPSVSPAPSASPSATASPSASAAPSASTPSPSSSPATSTPAPSTSPAPVGTALPAPPVGPGPTRAPVPVVPDAGVLPGVLQPSGLTPAAPEVTVAVPASTLPATGSDVAALTLLGLLTTTAGGALVLAGRRPRGRHVLR